MLAIVDRLMFAALFALSLLLLADAPALAEDHDSGSDNNPFLAGARDLAVVRAALERERPYAAPALVVEVWCGLARPARFDWMVEKCTEAGADVIRPLLSEHAARGEGTSEARQERWQRIAVEASEIPCGVEQRELDAAAGRVGCRCGC